MKKNKSKNLIKNTTILSFGNLCTKGLMFIMTPLLIRWLSQDSYGTFDLLTTYVTLLIPFISLSIGEATFRFLVDGANDKNKKRIDVIINSSFFVTICGFVLSLIVVITLSFCFENIKMYLFLLFILLICEGINNFFTYILRGLKKLPIYAVSNILFVIIICILSYLLVYEMKLGLVGIVLSYSMGYLISSLFGYLFIRENCSFAIKKIDFILIKDMLRYSLPLMPNSICWWIVNVSDRSIVSFVLGTSTNAIYAVANKIPNICQTFFGVFHLSWQENAVETKNDEDRDEYYSFVLNNAFGILASVCIIIISCNFIFYKYLFTSKYFEGYYQVPILIISLIFSTLSQFIGGIYISRMESKKNGLTTIIAAIINLVVHLSLIKLIGLYAATLSTLVSYLTLFIIRFVDIRKSVKLKFNQKSLIIFTFLIYFIISVYINNLFLNIVNIFLSILIFLILNRKIILKLINKILKN